MNDHQPGVRGPLTLEKMGMTPIGGNSWNS
jgi:hypothetical protein